MILQAEEIVRSTRIKWLAEVTAVKAQELFHMIGQCKNVRQLSPRDGLCIMNAAMPTGVVSMRTMIDPTSY